MKSFIKCKWCKCITLSSCAFSILTKLNMLNMLLVVTRLFRVAPSFGGGIVGHCHVFLMTSC